MSNFGNFTQTEKENFVLSLLKTKIWWISSPTTEDLLKLIDSFEDFREELDKD